MIEQVKHPSKNYISRFFFKNKVLSKNSLTVILKPFAVDTIYNILKNEKYLGVYKHNEEIIDNMYPKIIEKDLFEKIRIKTKKNNVGAKSVRTRFNTNESTTYHSTDGGL